MGPLLPDDSTLSSRLVRRTRGIVIESLALLLVTVLFPVLLLGAALVDAILWVRRRKPWMGVRLVAMLWWFLFGELRGITGLLLINLLSFGRDTSWRRHAVYRLRQHWAASHLGGVRVLFGLRMEMEGLELAAPGPVLVLIRHASIIDNALPDAVIGRTHGIGLRFVLKRELRMLPTIDIGGRWVPTNFVRRASDDPERELANLRLLAVELEPDEGVLIYPEGTRCTAAKLARAKAVIAERQPEIAPLAERLNNLLPPRLGGTLALLEQARGTDVVVCGHVGLDGFERVSDIWSGGLVGTTVRVRFWRHAAADVPAERDALVAWLYERWQALDDWVGEQLAATGAVRRTIAADQKLPPAPAAGASLGE
ncbi:MAG TPA: lysophospholipid acyltransferase family protein [Solirubrobacteraceae bacterium]|nr:lysophospholipid acyltransferase family protein [Solirubrobacteraceae bacterium]